MSTESASSALAQDAIDPMAPDGDETGPPNTPNPVGEGVDEAASPTSPASGPVDGSSLPLSSGGEFSDRGEGPNLESDSKPTEMASVDSPSTDTTSVDGISAEAASVEANSFAGALAGTFDAPTTSIVEGGLVEVVKQADEVRKDEESPEKKGMPVSDPPHPLAVAMAYNGPQPTDSSIRLTGVSVQGVSHLQSKDPCQDRHRWIVLPDGDIVIAVADGAGSAKFAEVGADLAVRHALESVETSWAEGHDVKTALRRAAVQARSAIALEAVTQGRVPRDYACTFALCWIKGDCIDIATIGDCMVFVLDEKGEAVLASELERGEFVNGTTFLTADNALEKLFFKSLEKNWRLVAVQSDGMQWVSMNLQSLRANSKLYQSVADRLADLQPPADVIYLRDLLRSLFDRSGGKCDDDLTAVCAVRGASG